MVRTGAALRPSGGSIAAFLAGVTVAATLAAGVPGWSTQAAPTPEQQIEAVTSRPLWANSRWGYHAIDLDDGGREVFSANAQQFFTPGSNAKVLSLSAAWNTFGADHVFRTPVHRDGRQVGGRLVGDLVLVGAGDLVMGGRGGTNPRRPIAYTNFDHNDANALPGVATLTPQDPLAGVEQLARKVRRAGITSISGDVVVDDRLFEVDRVQNPSDPVETVFLNENKIDMETVPTAVGQLARFDYRPRTSYLRVTSTVRTAAAGTGIQLRTREVGPGRVELSGTIAVDALSAPGSPPTVVWTYGVDDAPAFVRSAFIDALRARGVRITAPAGGDNPTELLPGAYRGRPVAVFRSPRLSEYVKLIMKVSLNVGANLMVCLQAVQIGSKECLDGLTPQREHLQRAGVPVLELAINDGQGRLATDWVTPRAIVRLLQWWADTKPPAEFARWRATMPILGRDGSLATVLPDSPAAGKVVAKTGTLAGGDEMNDRLILPTKALAGYADGVSGARIAFAVYVNNAGLTGLEDVFTANDDVGEVAAIIQQSS